MLVDERKSTLLLLIHVSAFQKRPNKSAGVLQKTDIELRHGSA